MSFRYACGKTLKEVQFWFHVPEDSWSKIVRELLAEGFTERGICYAASKAEDKLTEYVGSERFAGIFKNEVRKYALKPGDPRWENKRRF